MLITEASTASKKKKYPLPLIYETLRSINKVKLYTKLDVRAAFHKIKITEKDEWMIAFRTRYGLFEWLVTPFGLANAFNIFQRYINWALRDFLDEFCSAYVDDILIHINDSRTEHQKQVKKSFKTFAGGRIATRCQQMRIRGENDKVFRFHHRKK